MPKRRPDRVRRWTRGTVVPVIGVLAVVAAALGLHLGESAIGQIDPLYFRGRAPIPQDVSAQQRPLPRSAFAEASGWETGQASLAHDCGADCPGLHAREAGVAPASLGIGEVAPLPQPRSYAADPALIEEPVAPAADAGPVPRTNRYLHYPVSQEAEQAPPDYSDPAPAPAAAPHGRGDPEGM